MAFHFSFFIEADAVVTMLSIIFSHSRRIPPSNSWFILNQPNDSCIPLYKQIKRIWPPLYQKAKLSNSSSERNRISNTKKQTNRHYRAYLFTDPWTSRSSENMSNKRTEKKKQICLSNACVSECVCGLLAWQLIDIQAQNHFSSLKFDDTLVKNRKQFLPTEKENTRCTSPIKQANA